MIDTLLL